jgi:anti-sigma factor RsiW
MNEFESQNPCVWMQAHLEAYLDGDLSPTEVTIADLHLARCADCAAELKLARRVAGSLRSLPGQSCPARVTDTVRAHIGAAGNRRYGVKPMPWYYRWQELFKRPLMIGAVTALFVVLTAVVGTRSPKQPQYTRAQIEEAEIEAKMALALVSEITSRAGVAIEKDVLSVPLVKPALRAVKKKNDQQSFIQLQEVHDAG